MQHPSPILVQVHEQFAHDHVGAGRVFCAGVVGERLRRVVLRPQLRLEWGLVGFRAPWLAGVRAPMASSW